jgi:germination protein M
MARKRSSVGFVFWLGLVTAVLVVFVFSRPTIERVLDSTDFFSAVRPSGDAPVVVLRPSGQPPNRYVNQQATAEGAEATGPQIEPEPEPEARPQHAPQAEPEAATPPPVQDRTARVFFVMVDKNGEIQLRGVQRNVSADVAPLTSMLRELLAGPTAAEQRRDLISLLPDAVELHRVSVQDGTAVIDLGQAFRFSSHGREGLLARLKQLVYSATEFPTVDAVQVLIDGNNVDYLGPEGIYIGEPLTRESFDS